MELEQIEKEFLVLQITPSRLAELRVILSGKYAFAMNKLEEILLVKPVEWNKLRPEYKSDTATDRAWEATDLGLAELHWKFQVKKIERMMSASKTLIDAKMGEARNII